MAHEIKIYLVGGAVRDKLLGLPVKDRDYVVVGATPEALLAQGYQQVGRDFPVFLHPKTKEEYALARTERKTGQGYQGFACDFNPNITLEEDLIRRDLTINAIAEAEDGTLIDPYGGCADLENRVLRHVSDAFSEDPLRVLRLFRFKAKLPNFAIASETWQLVRKIYQSGEMATLTKERIWLELEKALFTEFPFFFFRGLMDLQALHLLGFTLDKNESIDFMQRLWKICPCISAPEQRLAYAFCGIDFEPMVHYLPVPKNYQYWLRLVRDHHNTIKRWSKALPEARYLAFKVSGSLKGEGDILALAHLLGNKNLVEKIPIYQGLLKEISSDLLIQNGYSGSALGEKIKALQMMILGFKVKANDAELFEFQKTVIHHQHQ